MKSGGRGSITKEILKYLLLVGAFYFAASSPYFCYKFWQNLLKKKHSKQKLTKRSISNSFYYLLKRGLIEIEREGADVKIALTEKGKKLGQKYQIDDLKIKTPKKWDGKWRIVIFDISQTKRIIRDIFRRKLKELGFYQLQKSVWVYPYSCEREIEILRKFLGVGKRNIRLIVAESIEEDKFLRKFFKL